MNDLISRQAAVDALKSQLSDWNDDYNIPVRKSIENIERLPSAQPEIVRCEDCLWGREACGNIECFVDINVPPEYHGYDWFCPNAERRTNETD